MKSHDVIVREVGLRDGLQLVKTFVPTETKLAWARAVATAGVPEIEIINFVPPKVIAQFADAAEVATAALSIKGPKIVALAPNRKGAENMLRAGVRNINFVLSVSEEHNLANVRKTVDQSFAEFENVVALRSENPEWKNVRIQGCAATSFGCTIRGKVDPDLVVAAAAPSTPTSTIRAVLASPTSMPPSRRASAPSTPRPAGSAAARLRPAPRATSSWRTSSSCSRRRDCAPALISKNTARPAGSPRRRCRMRNSTAPSCARVCRRALHRQPLPKRRSSSCAEPRSTASRRHARAAPSMLSGCVHRH